ncbi:hypothetical protein BZ17_1005 [Yersinia pseudotuberculosis IP 32953]|nr:hypothetical protein BZ21_848 [Yersinia pseudotuberculosis]AJJ53862.1 hypothetical protein BZ17_1005 [Yersinia pseudotuberculosis IP 32953]AJJ68885.1 hypothetical protein BZ16_924 [Yersinia pseudotuberculosis PB1/+]CQD54007.1 Uncharacterised protein [Yersinia intermedia]AJJ70943.1 hypothetical protein BZ23_1127 [Yersinia pseudotuberculosis]
MDYLLCIKNIFCAGLGWEITTNNSGVAKLSICRLTRLIYIYDENDTARKSSIKPSHFYVKLPQYWPRSFTPQAISAIMAFLF